MSVLKCQEPFSSQGWGLRGIPKVLWTEFVPPLSYAKALTLNVMASGGGLWGKQVYVRSRRGTPRMGLVPSQEEGRPEFPLSLPREDTTRRWLFRRQSPPGTESPALTRN